MIAKHPTGIKRLTTNDYDIYILYTTKYIYAHMYKRVHMRIHIYNIIYLYIHIHINICIKLLWRCLQGSRRRRRSKTITLDNDIGRTVATATDLPSQPPSPTFRDHLFFGSPATAIYPTSSPSSLFTYFAVHVRGIGKPTD